MTDAVRLQDAARQTGIPQGTLRLWAANGKIPTEKRGKVYLVRVDDIMARPEASRYSQGIPAGYVSSQTAAERTGYIRTTLCKMALSGRLHSLVGPGGARLFREADLVNLKSRSAGRTPMRREKPTPARRCSCCGRRPVAPGFRLLCQICYRLGEDRGEI